MSDYHVARIKTVLSDTFSGLIDMADWEGRPTRDTETALLSRALAALCIKSLAHTNDAIAAGSVVDAFDDGGIDALLFDQINDTFYFVQSKLSMMDSNAVGRFAEGVRDILAGKLERFNAKVHARQGDIFAALRATRLIKIVLITVHLGEQDIAAHGRRRIDDLVSEINIPSLPEQASAIHLKQSDVYALITAFATPPKIDMPITLRDWGLIERPFLGYYGRVNLLEVSGWWDSHKHALCSRNIRHFFQRSDVNDALRQTLINDPDSFWYFNNGITMVCDSVQKALAGTPGREIGLFNCRGVSVVNGAQTVGVIGSILSQAGAADARLQDMLAQQSWVQIRIISLENCPAGFDKLITQATNFQNAVDRRDFVAMDPLQQQLAVDFALDRKRYVYKSGEEEPRGEEGCSVSEATQALGCSLSMDLAVQVKREIGQLWSDIERAPYTDVFSRSLTCVQLWKAVKIMRAVDEELQHLRYIDMPRADLIAIHFNRALLHLVFCQPHMRAFRSDALDVESLVTYARAAINELFPKVAWYIEERHPGEYPASVCKNRDKCVAMMTALAEADRAATAVPPSEEGEGSGERQGQLL